MKEVDIGHKRCWSSLCEYLLKSLTSGLYSGSTFVDQTFEDFLHAKLVSEYPDTYNERHLIRGVKGFVISTKLQYSHDKRQSIYLELSDNEDEYNQGFIELQW